MAKFELADESRNDARAAWHRYLAHVAPFRPELHRYCRKLTGEIWDAEDLVQDTLLRGFGTLGSVHQRIANPRGYLIRIATNLWVDAQRRRGAETRALARAVEPPGADAPPPAHATDVREAGTVLMQQLSPQERAAFLMKDVFDMSLAEIAEALGTSVGAVKAALHRGRGRLERGDAAASSPRPTPPAELVDRFVERLAASDLPGLLELMADTGVVETVGSLLEVGRDQFEREGSWLWQSVHVHPDLPPEQRPPKWRPESGRFRGEPVMLSFSPFQGEDWLQSITRFEEQDGRIGRIRAYYFCPETMREVAQQLGHKAGHVLYHFPFDALAARD